MNEKGGIGRWLVVFLATAVIAAYACMRWAPTYNLKSYCAQIEESLNLTLAHQGVTDRQIRQSLRHEQSRCGLVWIESSRRVVVQNQADLDRIADSLENSARQKYCSVKQETNDEGRLITVSLLGLPVAKIWLVVAPRAVPRVKKPELLPAPAVAPGQARAAIVIDDVAYELASMDNFAALRVPLTFAILPRDKHSKDLSKKARSLRFPVLLHLPMEPHDLAHNNPGPSALYLGMTTEQLKEQFDQDVASVPGIVGINNHMGSAFTENEPKMSLVMQWIREKRLFFLDSRTTGKSVAAQVAQKTGVPFLRNETFLDNVDEPAAIEKQLDHVMALALHQKQTVAIGHYRRKHLIEALKKKIPEFKARGVTLVPLTAFYKK